MEKLNFFASPVFKNSGRYLHGMMAQTGCFGCNWVKLARFCRKLAVKWETGPFSGDNYIAGVLKTGLVKMSCFLGQKA